MSETTNEPVNDDSISEAINPSDVHSELGKTRREAAKYRTELRETQEQLAASQRLLSVNHRFRLAVFLSQHPLVIQEAQNDFIEELDDAQVASYFDTQDSFDEESFRAFIVQVLKQRSYIDQRVRISKMIRGESTNTAASQPVPPIILNAINKVSTERLKQAISIQYPQH